MSPRLRGTVELPAILRDAPEVALGAEWAADLEAALADVAAGRSVYTDSDEAFEAELAEDSSRLGAAF